MVNIKKITHLFILIISISISYADNEFVHNDLYTAQIKGPIQSYTTYVHKADSEEIVFTATRNFDVKGFATMGIITLNRPDFDSIITEIYQPYSNNQRDIFTLLSTEKISLAEAHNRIKNKDYMQKRERWKDQRLYSGSVDLYEENPDQQFKADEWKEYDAQGRVIHSNQRNAVNTHYITFREYQRLNLSDYDKSHQFIVTANLDDVTQHVENDWQTLDPRIKIIFIESSDEYGNPLVQYHYSSQLKQKIVKKYHYY
ncbi:MAG: hypothetical protein ACRCXK_12355 [Wohlfahrtiimonas sp.]